MMPVSIFQFMIGSGVNVSDFTYSDNVAHAHICAAEALDSRHRLSFLLFRLVWFVSSLLKWTQEKDSIGSYYDTAHQFTLLASSTRTFNCDAAKKYLGYTPVLEECIASTFQWFSRDLEKSDDTTTQSKADQLLGCGKDSAVRDLSKDIVLAWNHGVGRFKSLSRGRDWIKFFKRCHSRYEVELYHLAWIFIEYSKVLTGMVLKNLLFS
ncbi:unnamed protein product [Thlaspi arvense]|uniref:3-beta hydroxysteroid dehydrogenase/isomerase domain-containing protein n=1 Tax=Thlaspi arvense TaxID=13288 RepID=A0AAU9S920_THLAR|nr:unnamed protein product [Thlaspi arvense]